MIEKFEGVITALEPVSHVEKTIGIVSKFRREKVFVDGHVELVPLVSGNSLRGLLRRCGARHLMQCLKLGEKDVSVYFNHVLFRGGMLKRGEAAVPNPNFECKFRETFPLLSVFGTAVRQQLIHSKLNVGLLVPIAAETTPLTQVPSNVSVWDLCQQVQYTRRDDRQQKDPDPANDNQRGPLQPEQMLYRTEVLIPGTKFTHYFELKDATPVERACLMRCLSEFQSGEMRIGGNARIGHGRVSWSYEVKDTKAYDDHIANRKDDIIKLIGELDE